MDIKTVRERLNLSTRRFAEELGVSQRTVYYWEKQNGIPNKKIADKICELANLEYEVIKRIDFKRKK